MSDFTPQSSPAEHDAGTDTARDVRASLKAQLRELEYMIASLGAGDEFQQTLLQLERFETNLMTHLEAGPGGRSPLAHDMALAAEALTAATSAEEVGHALLSFAAQAGLDMARFCLVQPDSTGEPSYLELVHGCAREGHPPLADCSLFAVLSSGTPLTVEDTTTDTRLDDATRHLLSAEGIGSFMVVPIPTGMPTYAGGERRQGLFVVSRDEPATYDDDFRYSLLAVAGQATTTLEKLSLHGEVEKVRLREEWTAELEKTSEALKEQIGEGKRAEGALAHERGLLQTLMDNVPDMIFFKDAESRFIQTNRSHARFMGLADPQEAVGKTDFDFWDQEDAQRFYDEEQAIIQSGQPILDRVGQTPDLSTGGQLRWLSETKMPLRDEAGKVIGLVGIARDITERKRAEEALQEREHQLKTVLDSVQAGIIIIDAETRKIVDANPAALQMIGAARDSVIGSICHGFICPAEQGCCPVCDLGESVDNSEHALLRDNGEEVSIIKTVVPMMLGSRRCLIESFIDVTERKQAEEALREERNLLRTLVDNVPDFIFVKDTESRFVLNNTSHLRVLGATSQDEALGKTDFDFFPQDLAASYHADEQAVIQSGQPLFDREETYIDQRGDSRWLLTTKVPLRDNQGNIIGLIGISRDITERKRAEEALAYEHDLLQTLMDNVPDMIFFKDAESRFIQTNRAHARFMGLADPQEAIGKTDFDLWDQEVAQSFYDEEQAIIRSGQPILDRVGQTPDLSKDGELCWLSESKIPLRNEAGQVIGLVGIARDITERKRAEEALQESEDRYRDLVEHSRDLICTHDLEGQILSVNQEAAKRLGYDTSALLKKNIRDILAPEVREEFDTYLATIQKEGAASGLMLLQTSTGERRIWEYHNTLRTEGVAEPIVRGTAHDVTERKQAERALRKAHEELAQYASDLERRSTQLQTAAEVSHAIASILDPDRLLQQVVDLVQERLALYYAGLFLTDQIGEWAGEPGKWAVLRAGTGEAGQQMLAEGHKLEIGGTSMVGWCIANNQARIALDVGEEAVRFVNPLLPKTRSEMALPLICRGQIIGAMTVQSVQEAAFSDEDIAVLQTMADQVAVAIENARLLTRTQSALEEVRSVHQHYLRQEWGVFLASHADKDDIGYLLSRDGIEPMPQIWSPEIDLAVKNRQPIGLSDVDSVPLSDQNGDGEVSGSESVIKARSALAAPITLRGQVIGALDLFDPDQPREWTDDDLALVDAVTTQVALAVENARLFEQTQEALQETETLYRASTELNTARTYDDILTVLRVYTLLGQADRNISLNLFERPWIGEDMPKWSIPIARWSTLPPEALSPRYPLRTFPSAARLLRPDAPTLITDVEADPDLDDSVRELYSRRFRARSTIFVPLTVGGRWIGYINGIYGKRTEFLEAPVRRLMTLAGQAAVVVQNLRQLQEIEARARREAVIREIGAKVSSSMDMKTVLQTTVRELSHALGASQAIIRMGTQPEEPTPNSEETEPT
jgi:PAS domain S-box-containing protein